MAMNALRQHPLLFAAIALALVLGGVGIRSEEHTSELQSSQISYAVFCLKKKRQPGPPAPQPAPAPPHGPSDDVPRDCLTGSPLLLSPILFGWILATGCRRHGP